MIEETQKPGRGRPATGKAKTSAERNKTADAALVAAGGRVLRVRLSPEAAAALSVLAAKFESDKQSIDAALIFTAKNL